jgi:hypothetical protein
LTFTFFAGGRVEREVGALLVEVLLAASALGGRDPFRSRHDAAALLEDAPMETVLPPSGTESYT